MSRGDRDRMFCAEVLPGVSRTFALSIEALPEDLARPVRAAYLLCRVVDTVEDAPRLPPGTRDRLFDAFDRALLDDRSPPEHLAEALLSVDLRATPDEQRLCAGVGSVLGELRRLPPETREIICPHVAEMSSGMREYSARLDRDGALWIEDVADLERYCYHVAGTVGLLLTPLFAAAVPGLDPGIRAALDRRAVPFGTGLQLVNVLKDVAGDVAEGRIFLPRSLAARHGLDLDRLLEPDQREAGLAVIRELSARARSHLDRAEEYTHLWPLPAGEAPRRFCAVPLALARATLDEVERGRDTLLPGRAPKVGRELVGAVLARVHAAP